MLSVIFILCLMQNVFVQHVSGQKIKFTVPKKYTNLISLYYFKGPTLDDPIVLKLEDGLNLTKQKHFDVNSTTIFYLHGWGENATNGGCTTVASAFRKKKIRNIVVFNYGQLVRSELKVINYVISAYNATFIGQAIGEFFKLYIPKKQPLKLIKMVSYSMGSQIMAKISRVFGIGQLKRLTALDPAGPIYVIPGIKHLNKNDGKFVDIIHTDGGFFGDRRTIGTVDFFPNRGTRYQPGCNSHFAVQDFVSNCSHRRSYQYYAESITNPKAFLAMKCKRSLLISHCKCNKSDVTYMGYYIDTSVHGTYFLKTNGHSPFGQGRNGSNV